jgi:hypothetical protein
LFNVIAGLPSENVATNVTVAFGVGNLSTGVEISIVPLQNLESVIVILSILLKF